MFRASLLLALLVSGCSVAGPSDSDIEAARSPEAEGVIVNRSSDGIVAFAMTAEYAALVDPLPELNLTLARWEVLASGAAAPLPIEGYETGANVTVFVYRVRGSTAPLTSILQIDSETFQRDQEVVVVRF